MIERVLILSGRGKWDKIFSEPSMLLSLGGEIHRIEFEEQCLTERW